MKHAFLAALALAALPLTYVAARVSAPEPAPVSAPAAIVWTIDPVHSSMVFKIRHKNVANFYGTFNELAGTVSIDDAKPEASKVELTVKAESVDSRNDGRDKHLRSPDFFNVAEFPEIKFVSKSVQKAGDKRWKVSGDLSLHGVTKPLSVEVVEVGTESSDKGKLAGFDVQFTLKRSDHGMNFMLDALGDEVTVMAGIECKGQ